MLVSRAAFYMHDLSGGGVERMRLALIAELRARGIQATLVLDANAGELASLLPADLPMVTLGARRTAAALRPLVRFLRAACPDVLVSSQGHNNVIALAAARLAGVGTRVVICQHNALSSEQRAGGWRYRALPWLYRLLQGGAHGIVAVSRGVADDLAAGTGIPGARITTIYNPVIGGDFAARSSAPPPHPWLIDKTCPVFVFVGRLVAQKDPQLVLDALARLPPGYAARVIFVGSGPLRPDLEATATRLGVTASVAFAGFQANPLPWIRHADALLSTSRYEGLGNVIIEALACGTPVIATDCPHGPFEILLGGLLGRLVPVGDAPALARAMAAQIGRSPDGALLRWRAASFTTQACADAHLALFAALPAPRRAMVHALGLAICPLHACQVVDWIMRVRAAEQVLLVVTPNLHHVRLLRRPDFAAAYASARLICPDGYPVMVYARWRGLKLPVRVTGCELFHHLAAHPALPQQTLFLVLESEATARAARAWARRLGLAPRIHVAVAGEAFGGDAAQQASMAISIRHAAPTILVITLGAPVSELFVHQHRHLLPPCWALCVGQAVRVELGLATRAPPA